MTDQIEKKPTPKSTTAPSDGTGKPDGQNRHGHNRHRHNRFHHKPKEPKDQTAETAVNPEAPQKAHEAGKQNNNGNSNNNNRNHGRHQRNGHRNSPPKQVQGEKQKNSNSQPTSPAKAQEAPEKETKQQTAQREIQTKRQESQPIRSLLDIAPENDSIFGASPGEIRKIKTHTFTNEELNQVRKFDTEELFGTDHLVHPINSSSEDAVEVIAVRFKKSGKSYYFAPGENKFNVGDFAVLETARGPEFGEVSMENRTVEANQIVQPLRQVIRPATKEDIERHQNNKRKEAEAFNICLEKIANHQLDMKLIEAQYAFDNSKLLFYFTSAGRVDFRELVRDLASVFKTRIELRQIGIRDEAKMLGGIGICGRPLCCSRFLSNFAQVSIKMAKEQGLSLNSGKISGTCGRLMCCLNFENQTYLDEIKNTPMPGSVVKLDGKTGTVTEATPLIGMIKVHLNDTPANETVTVHRDSVTVLVKKGSEVEDGDTEEE